MSEPNWGNTHAKDCRVTLIREELWTDFCRSISNGPDERNPNSDCDTHRDFLWGCVIEYAAGGDEDSEACNCNLYPR